MNKLIDVRFRSPGSMRRTVIMWCPGCEDMHRIYVDGDQATWTWNGNEDVPTFSPSILVLHGDNRCHSFVVDGVWQFLDDCTHSLAGQHVPMIPLPDWILP